MGIRFEKDTLMNWMNEIGKYLRLITDRYSAFEEVEDTDFFNQGYIDFFGKDRSFFLGLSDEDLMAYIRTDLEVEQLRPLGLVMMQDGLHSGQLSEQQNLLMKARLILDYVIKQTSSFAFEDYGYLATIDAKLK
ncbi:hypothetical protein [Sphingobacterium sp. SYP-B4668]|uniref:hypothetical protein n=1 Tax=Sphingobacterium sp. SYP-B4668 TaxID=2996035 RepID=UPI0022DD37C4|nr:hypothetical protein [Sphingobacterium sp. SYP-B4668]